MNSKLIPISKLKGNNGQIESIYEIPGYEGLYYIDLKGNIYSNHSRNLKKIKKALDAAGYEIVSLCNKFNKKTKSVHRLMMLTHFGESRLCVNHKNGIKSDNRIENLEYVTYSQNTRHALETKLFIPNTIGIAESKRKKVSQINIQDMSQMKIYNSSHEAAKMTGINRGNICSVCRGIKPHAGGYFWVYIK